VRHTQRGVRGLDQQPHGSRRQASTNTMHSPRCSS
jgi:hypothetical protein